jgi:hypothetical protein
MTNPADRDGAGTPDDDDIDSTVIEGDEEFQDEK